MVPGGAALSLFSVRLASWPVSAALSVVLGLAHAASIAAPWNGQAQGWLQTLSMAGLVGLLLQAPSARLAALRGWLFSSAWLCGTFWWLYISMHTYGGLAAPLAVGAVVALAALLSVYYAAVCGLFKAWAGTGRPVDAILWPAMVFAAGWTMAEMARGTWLTGFGWGAAAYAHVDGLGTLARHVGAYGVGFIAAFIAACLGAALGGMLGAGGGRVLACAKGLAPGVLLLAVAALPVREVSAPAGNLDVALLQGNIKQSEKFQPSGGIADALKWYGDEALRRATPPGQPVPASPLLVVLPETALPLLPSQLPEGYLDALESPFRRGGQAALLTGIPLVSLADGYTNSVRGVGPGQVVPYQYDKHHLVPFGEFIPPLFKWFTQLMNIPLGDFNRGAVGQASFAFAGQRLAPNICYEDLFGEELAARFADPARAPTVMVNISNIGWFGNTVAIDQHRNISRMRALEFERPMVRATNTGDTAVIDHRGQVTAALARHTRGVLLAPVQGRGPGAGGDGITPFAWWAARFGLWPLWGGSVAIVLIAYLLNRKRIRRPL